MDLYQSQPQIEREALKKIFTLYNLALLILDDFMIKIKFQANKYYFKDNDTQWILLA